MAVSRRRFLSTSSTAAGAGAILAACGGGPAAIQQNKTSREVTLRWNTWGNDTHIFNVKAVPAGLKLFNEKYPNIKVSPEPQLTGWDQKNLTEWIAGAGPDIAGPCCQHAHVWARQGLLWDMSAGLKKDVPDKIKGDFVEWLLKLFNEPGIGQFALPMYTGVTALFYNKDLFTRAGVAFPDATWDWAKYREAATKLTKAGEGKYGRRLITSYDRILQRIHSNGGNWVDSKDDTKPAFDQPKALEALRYEFDAAHKERIAIRENVADAFPAGAGKNYFQAFSDGTFAMMEEGSWILANATLPANIPDGVQWDAAPMPKGPAGRVALATNDGWAIWKGSKATDESWELVKFLMTDEWNEIASRDGGQQSGRKSFQDRWEKLIKEANPKLANKNLTPFKEAITKNEAKPIELFRKHVDALAHVNNLVLNGSIRDGKTNVDAAVKEAVQLIAALPK